MGSDGISLVNPWDFEVPLGLPWCSHGTSVVGGTCQTSEDLHGISMGFQWDYRSTSAAFRGTVEFPRDLRGASVRPPHFDGNMLVTMGESSNGRGAANVS